MRKTLKEIAELINGEVVGDGGIIITGIAGIKEAVKGDITFVANPKYLPLLKKTRASAVITSRELKNAPKPIIRTENPSLAFSEIVSLANMQTVKRLLGIHPTAILGEGVSLGKDVAIGAYTVIEDEVSIGNKTVIYAGCYVGEHCKIGEDSVIYPHVSIRENVTIGKRVIIHSGTVIGSEGFGFLTLEGKHQRIPQMGGVVIEDDVDIGSNVTIDRARFDKTIIGRGTKIDNLVQIAHNVAIGENSLIIAQVGIAGSVTIGKNVTLAGQAGLAGHISVGDGAVVAAKAGVTKSVPAHTTVFGYPAKPHNIAKRVNACVQNLPKLYDTVAQLKKKIGVLEKKRKWKTRRQSKEK